MKNKQTIYDLVKDCFPTACINTSNSGLISVSPQMRELIEIEFTHKEIKIRVFHILLYSDERDFLINQIIYHGEYDPNNLEGIAFILKNYKSVGRLKTLLDVSGQTAR